MSLNGSPAMEDVAVARWDRQRWISVFSSHNPTIREVTECLGLGLSASSSTTNRGIPKFDNPDYRRLSSEVTKLSKELPKERDALLDFAADPNSLNSQLEQLLDVYGPAIWGREADRTCLLTPDPAKKTYIKELFYEDPEDKEIIKVHLHRWIIIKACYYIRNMKLKRPSAGVDYESLAELDAEAGASPSRPLLLSSNGTPQPMTPPHDTATAAGAESGVNPIAGQKRKSSAFISLSDGEEHTSTPAKRPYQSQTMPLQRKSPRKSLNPIAEVSHKSTENIPPLQSQNNHSQSTLAAAPAPDAARPLLSPLSSNDLNGTARPVKATPASSAFTAVNTGGFTAVNTGSNGREPPRESPGQNATEACNYQSPYDTSPYGTATHQNAPNSGGAPPIDTTPRVANAFQAINSPTVANGVNTQNSPVVQHSVPAHIAPQPQPQSQQQPHASPQPHAPPQPQPQLLPSQPSQQQSPPQTHVHIQPHAQHHSQVQPQAQPASQSDTPSASNHVRPNVSHHPHSRSNTPIAPAPNAPVAHTVHAANTQAPPAPNVQAAPTHNLQLVPTPNAQPAHVNAHIAPQPTTQQHPSVHPTQPILKSQPIQPAPVVGKGVPVTDIRLLQCEVLGLLIQYLFPKNSSPPDEDALLYKLESLWQSNSLIFRPQLSTYYDICSKVLSSWILERRKISTLKHGLVYTPGVPASEMVDRLLAMNDLRLLRLKWKNMSSVDGVSPEDLLCRTFAIATNTEGTEYLFKDGLERLGEGVFDFLRSEDMRIMMHKR